MSQEQHPPTRFLPAERAPAEEVERQAALVRSFPLVAALLDAGLGLALVLNRHRQIVHLNRAFQEFLTQRGAGVAQGLRLGEVLECANVPSSPGGCGTEEGCKLCGSGRTLGAGLAGASLTEECRIRTRQSGDDLDLLVRTTVIEIADELFLLVSAMDISHEKRRRTLERIFFHDITNTAGGISGLAGLMTTASPETVSRRYAPMIRIASNALLDEVTSQRDLTAAEHGDLVLRPTTFAVRTLLADLAAMCRHHEVARERSVAIAETPEDLTVRSDRTLLQRVLGNLVKNALEAEPAGGRVGVSCRREGERVVFEVRNPTPMAQETQLQMFQRSFSTKGPGRGLGTYSIRLLSERYLQGKVSFTSNPESGTCFVVDYPVALAEMG
ncbi:MAG: HAMP domain-containing sensor histidine kinase [Myxococcales bacterium]